MVIMSNHLFKASLLLLLNFFIIFASSAQRQVYVVYLGEHKGQKTLHEIEEKHHAYLHSLKGWSLEEAKSSIIYSYTKVINGFSAFLTPQEADAISEMDGVISVYKDEPQEVHTSRSWDFIDLLEANGNSSQANGLEELWRKANSGTNVIVGVFDTGIWPESLSFNDTGMNPIPSSWRGVCQTGAQFTTAHCNRKLIGARYYVRGYEAQYGAVNPSVEYRSARDKNGHGTHVASTLGGRRVANAAAVGGFGMGIVQGGAHLVRLAMYKVCWVTPAGTSTCFPSDILAAFDDAIDDGVHVISASIGYSTSNPFNRDNNAIGSLNAVKRNIVVAFSAGNSGPTSGSVSNIAPWFITVGASSIDRVFSSPPLLGNNYIAQGQSITPFQRATYQLVFAGDIEIPGTTTTQNTGRCFPGTLSPTLARGKVVFCLPGGIAPTLEVQRAGGAAAILGNTNNGIGVNLIRYQIPATVVLANETYWINTYIKASQAPTATLTPATTLLGTTPAPFMAYFTARGPATVEPNILKPDIAAPGLNILAAYTEANSPDNRFSFASGTSMACPHVSAIAALLKAIHPSWSNAAIQSAIMTTAKVTNNLGHAITDSMLNPATPFEYGSGHIQPLKAADPGLVYDVVYTEYLLFLCASIGQTLDPAYICPSSSGIPPQSNLNYPSLSIANVQGLMYIPRRVTNVGLGNATYYVTINQPAGYFVQISPPALHFSATGQTLGFQIIVQALSTAVRNQYAFGSYTWNDGVHQVRSPIAVSTGNSIITSQDAELRASV